MSQLSNSWSNNGMSDQKYSARQKFPTNIGRLFSATPPIKTFEKHLWLICPCLLVNFQKMGIQKIQFM